MSFTESSEALNHRLITVFCAAWRTSPPSPKTTLPASMRNHILLRPPIEKMKCPRTQRPAVKTSAILGPLVSISIPPKSGTTTLGKA